MKGKIQSAKNNKPVTLKQLKQALKPILGKFPRIDNRFETIDKRFENVEHRMDSLEHRMDSLEHRMDSLEHRMDSLEHRMDSLEHRMDSLEKAIHNLEEMFKDNFTKMYSHIDAFMKRTESNEHEIVFLGRQHDDLAKYCTEKIAYPIYGRN
ncbi:hypothetical protein HZC21_02425 [Candidatus Peregrinibacteria bacterium]|nr:hypothetical protein [Candidatus Peregrinibacteria bacterium]